MEPDIAEKFEKLYLKVFKYAVWRAGNVDAAHDLIMDVYTKILAQFRETNELPEQLEFYTMRAIKNKQIDIVRSAQRRDYLTEYYGYIEQTDDSLPTDPFEKRRIERAMGELGKVCQETLNLIGMGWKYNEIHKLTQMPLNTVASTVSRCRNKFRKHLDDLASESEQD